MLMVEGGNILTSVADLGYAIGLKDWIYGNARPGNKNTFSHQSLLAFPML
jgi:hypothetical protein